MVMATFGVNLFALNPLTVLIFGKSKVMRFRGFYYSQTIYEKYSYMSGSTIADENPNMNDY